ncbi:MAG: ornithine cyclodeaminase family protein, partial [Deltaproteobacteria bacterium]|nr:ornithine cyclodeaminase family protein [Deltaproteobacteria bacterium]
MDWIDAKALARALPYRDLVEGLEQSFREGCELPERGHHPLGRVDGEPATLLLMPAWRSGRSLGVKVVTVFPSNRRRGEPSVYGTYLLLDPTTGRPLAALDGTELTRRRTAAAS